MRRQLCPLDTQGDVAKGFADVPTVFQSQSSEDQADRRKSSSTVNRMPSIGTRKLPRGSTNGLEPQPSELGILRNPIASLDRTAHPLPLDSKASPQKAYRSLIRITSVVSPFPRSRVTRVRSSCWSGRVSPHDLVYHTYRAPYVVLAPVHQPPCTGPQRKQSSRLNNVSRFQTRQTMELEELLDRVFRSLVWPARLRLPQLHHRGDACSARLSRVYGVGY